MNQPKGKRVSLVLNLANADLVGFHDLLIYDFPPAALVNDAYERMATLLGIQTADIKIWHNTCWVDKEWRLEDFWETPLKLNVDIVCGICGKTVMEAKDLCLNESQNGQTSVKWELCMETSALLEEAKCLGRYKYDQKQVAIQAVRMARNVVQL